MGPHRRYPVAGPRDEGRHAQEVAVNTEILQIELRRVTHNLQKGLHLQKAQYDASRLMMSQVLEAAFSLNAQTRTDGEEAP